MRSISSLLSSVKTTTSFTVGLAFVRVPVLSNTMVEASDTASMYLPPLTVICSAPASRIADSTVMGMDSLSAQEKSTIKTASAFDTFLVRSPVRTVPASV